MDGKKVSSFVESHFSLNFTLICSFFQFDKCQWIKTLYVAAFFCRRRFRAQKYDFHNEMNFIMCFIFLSFAFIFNLLSCSCRSLCINDGWSVSNGTKTEKRTNSMEKNRKKWDGSKIIRVVCDLCWYSFAAKHTHGIKYIAPSFVPTNYTKIGVCAFKMLGCGLLYAKRRKKNTQP